MQVHLEGGWDIDVEECGARVLKWGMSVNVRDHWMFTMDYASSIPNI